MSDRKRLASSVPSLDDSTPAPNKSLKLPQAGPEREAYMQEKGLLKLKVQEASVKPFFLQPHVFAVSPVLKNNNPFPVSSLIGQKDKFGGGSGGLNTSRSSPLVAFGVSPSPPAASSPFMNFLRSSPNAADIRYQSSSQQSPINTDFKRPAAHNYYPWFNLPPMFGTVSPVSPFTSSAHVSPNLSSVPPSPANMFHHPPLTMLPKPNYPVCSVRSVGGVRSEYTVGPNHARPGDLVVDETGSNSGRATPASDSGDEDNDLLELEGSDLAPPNVSVSIPAITVTTASSRETCTVSSYYSGLHTRTSVTSIGSAPSSVCSQDCHVTAGIVQERPSSGVSSMSSDSATSTPEPLEAVKAVPSLNAMEDDVFCHVPGRLSLLSSTPKYKVTVGEVRRRLLRPECLNASILGGILRRAKSKNGGHVLRQKLESIGLSLPPGRRKATEVNLLTSLVEEEAHHLSNDFRKSCDRHFPHAELAKNVGRLHAGTPEVEQRIAMVQAAQTLVAELQSVLSGPSATPSSLRPTDPHNPTPGLSHFSLITHGFGPRTVDSSLNVLQTYLDDLISVYEGKEPMPSRHIQQQQHIAMHTQTERSHHSSTSEYGIVTKHETLVADHCCKR